MESINELRTTAHPVRLQILSLLTGNSMSQGEIARELSLSTANVGYHLNQLKRAGLLKVTGTRTVRGGTSTRYTYDLDSMSNNKSKKRSPLLWRAAASELIRRAAFFRSGTQLFADAEIWIDEEKWRKLTAEMFEISSQVHKAAMPKNHPKAIKVNMTVAMFEMKM
jgi:DNA-binding transcriptional ArsR family regulator